MIRNAAARHRQRIVVACALAQLPLLCRPSLAMDAATNATLPAAPSIAAVSIDGNAPPGIEGDISDAIWSRAQRVERSFRSEPQALIKPTERTDAWVIYDRTRHYVAVHAHDSEPGELSITTISRDRPLRNDDVVRVMIDPLRTRRKDYLSGINTDGAHF